MKGFAVSLSCCIKVSGDYIETGHSRGHTRINVMLNAKSGWWLVVSTIGSRINPRKPIRRRIM
jgi:hypothetical protein